MLPLQSQLVFLSVVVFVCSTTGQGDEPDNMRQFWRFLLQKGLPEDSLASVRFSVMGLGDSSYPKYGIVFSEIDPASWSSAGTTMWRRNFTAGSCS